MIKTVATALALVFIALPPSSIAVAAPSVDPFRSTDPPGAVPEPATWAMLIAGFGLVGAALRRRERLDRERLAREHRAR